MLIKKNMAIAQKKYKAKNLEKATFAAGCFWGVQAAFQDKKGVIRVTSGYTGGKTKHPGYEEVCSGQTGHAEAVELEFDPGLVSYKELLEIFWKIHDPTAKNRQGPDIGSQYRSAIFYHSPEQKKIARASKNELGESPVFNKKLIVTEITAARQFYKAEEYHQDFYKKRRIKPVCHLPGSK